MRCALWRPAGRGARGTHAPPLAVGRAPKFNGRVAFGEPRVRASDPGLGIFTPVYAPEFDQRTGSPNGSYGLIAHFSFSAFGLFPLPPRAPSWKNRGQRAPRARPALAPAKNKTPIKCGVRRVFFFVRAVIIFAACGSFLLLFFPPSSCDSVRAAAG